VSLRGIVNAITLAMVGLALAAALGFAATTTLMHRATTRLSDATEGLRAAEEIESDLLVHNVQSYLWLSTGDPTHRQARDAAVGRLGDWLALARAHAVDRREVAIVDEVERAVRAHVANWETVEREGIPPLEGFRRTAASLEPAYRVADELVAVNLAQARQALAISERWNHGTDVAAAVAAVALAGVAFGGGFLLRRALYRPLLALRSAMHRFAAGDHPARADTRGPAELAEVARDFNRLADALQRERADRIAFVAAVAHDLKNPLAALKTAASRPARGDGAALDRRFALIRRQVDRMDRMLGDFLDISRIEAGQLELRPESVDVAHVARGVAELFGSAAAGHELVVSAPDQPVWIRADPVRIEQVFDNLISNAIKYSPDGGRVDVRVGRRDDAAVIEVQDRGIGIDPADREKIFEPFRRLDTRADLPGVGLGLAVTRKLIEGHGGRIDVDSAPGRGSTFRVELPAGGTA
jgi:signal transduction histidine kinase